MKRSFRGLSMGCPPRHRGAYAKTLVCWLGSKLSAQGPLACLRVGIVVRPLIRSIISGKGAALGGFG